MSKISKDSSSEELYKKLAKMQKEASFTDVMLECDDGVTIPCHRVVLAAQSTVFKAMFDNGFLEGATSTAKIRGYRSTTIKMMVAEMYGDREEFISSLCSQINDEGFSVLLDLLSAAHQYDFPNLVSVCQRILIKRMSSDNAAEVYLKGFLTNLDRLKTAAMKFIYENFEEVEKTNEWKELAKNYPQAIHEMLAFVCKKM